jgi:hypothetical protein
MKIHLGISYKRSMDWLLIEKIPLQVAILSKPNTNIPQNNSYHSCSLPVSKAFHSNL